jgi:hypothetical protein
MAIIKKIHQLFYKVPIKQYNKQNFMYVRFSTQREVPNISKQIEEKQNEYVNHDIEYNLQKIENNDKNKNTELLDDKVLSIICFQL